MLRVLGPIVRTALLLVFVACYHYTASDHVLGEERLPGSTRVESERHDLDVVSMPTLATPLLTVRLMRSEQSSYLVRRRFEALRAPRREIDVLGGLVLIGGGGAAFLAKSRHMVNDTLSDDGKLLTGIGALSALGGLVLAARGLRGEPPERAPGVVKLGPPEKRTEWRSPEAMGGVQLRVDAVGVTRALTTDGSGIARVNMVSDLGIASEDASLPIRVSVRSLTPPAQLERVVDPRTWLSPCVRMRGSGDVYSRPEVDRRAVIGRYSANDRFALVDESTPGWLRITYAQAVGWIPVSTAARCWRRP